MLFKLVNNNTLYSLSVEKDYMLLGFAINHKPYLIKIEYNEIRMRYYLLKGKFENISKFDLKELFNSLF